MNILITNDDGINSPGIAALAKALSTIGQVKVLAPQTNWSATGHLKTMNRPLRVQEACTIDGLQGWACDGSPADCAALGIRGFFDEKIDLVVSGINTSCNMGQDVVYSGTVAAAMEAMILGVPSIAVSLDKPDDYNPADVYEPAAITARSIVEVARKQAMNTCYFLNVNVPLLPEKDIKGIRITRLGTRIYRDQVEKRVDPRGGEYYWVIGDIPKNLSESGTDLQAVLDGFVSVTPLHYDSTAYPFMGELEDWNWYGEEAEQGYQTSIGFAN